MVGSTKGRDVDLPCHTGIDKADAAPGKARPSHGYKEKIRGQAAVAAGGLWRALPDAFDHLYMGRCCASHAGPWCEPERPAHPSPSRSAIEALDGVVFHELAAARLRFTFGEEVRPQGGKLAVALFHVAQRVAHDLARGAVTAACHLVPDEDLSVLAQAQSIFARCAPCATFRTAAPYSGLPWRNSPRVRRLHRTGQSDTDRFHPTSIVPGTVIGPAQLGRILAMVNLVNCIAETPQPV